MTRAFTLVTAVLAVATLAGLVLLWPGEVESQIAQGIAVETETATVERVEEEACPGFTGQDCQLATARFESGPETGKRVQVQLGGGGLDPDVDPGDEVRLAKAPEPPPGSEAVAGTGYTLYDFERRGPMLLLAGLFVVVVLAFARWRGALSLAGLAVSLALVLLFVVPAILDGEEPLLVAVVGSLAIALITIPLAHGWGPKSIAALLGTAASLILTALLALLFTNLTHLTGLASEEAIFLQVGNADVSLQGLLLAGMVIGALGVLDDVTISQASTVLALRRANASFGFRQLFGRALNVGRDHVSATVNTLVLAYVGASLPILLLFSAADLGVSEATNLEVVAKEIVATLVGSIGLIAAVPVTTALAALLASETAGSDPGA
ncbi:MAG TPA: YibE/F family protein [Thermoleophilaceae bacterium]|nr:YibE/F family protein [Thermoleophilaceae bacterium]